MKILKKYQGENWLDQQIIRLRNFIILFVILGVILFAGLITSFVFVYIFQWTSIIILIVGFLLFSCVIFLFNVIIDYRSLLAKKHNLLLVKKEDANDESI